MRTDTKHKRIGKGLWTTAYQVDEKTVEIVTADWSKECMHRFCQGNPYIPCMEYVDTGEETDRYRMPYYHKLRAKHKTAWADYKDLKAFADSLPGQINPNIWREKLEQDTTMNAILKDAVDTLLRNFMNYANEMFLDVYPRNMGVDDNGHLILLDVLVDVHKLQEVRDRQRKRREASQWVY